MDVVKCNLYNNKLLSCALKTNVKNASDIRKQIVAGLLKCTVVKPSLIVDTFQICVAANKAILADSHGKLTTKSLYTEILFNLSVSKNISQSLLKFGVDDTDSEMLVVSFEDDEKMTRILSKIDGDVVHMSQLSRFVNEKAIHKTYKISDNELRASSLIDAVVSKIATKDFVNY